MVVRPRCRARVGCCQSNGAGYPKGCPAPLVFGCPLARQRCECTNKGRLGKLLTHFADCSSASFNFYSAFLKLLRGSELQFIASLMRRKFRKKLAPLLFFMSEHKSFCAKRKKLLGSIIGGANYPKGAYGADWRKPTKPTRAKDVRLLLFLGLPLARQRGLSAVVQLYPPTR